MEKNNLVIMDECELMETSVKFFTLTVINSKGYLPGISSLYVLLMNFFVSLRQGKEHFHNN